MIAKGIGGHTLPNKGRTNDWLTPPDILRYLGKFDLDPCCPPNMPWETASLMYSQPADNGLKLPWAGRVWLNPPYGPDTDRWMFRLAEHNHGTALIFARTETACWFKHVWPKATAVFFFEGRLHFHYPNGQRAKANAGGPSALIAYGESDATQIILAGFKGKYLKLK